MFKYGALIVGVTNSIGGFTMLSFKFVFQYLNLHVIKFIPSFVKFMQHVTIKLNYLHLFRRLTIYQ